MRPPVVNETSALSNVAIVGRPNVGKSALFNRLVGRKIAIVHDQPGITRDRISAIWSRGEQPFTLWDTGGIFGAGEKELTVQVRQTAEGALRESDLLLFVVDGKDGLSPIDSDLARTLRKARNAIVQSERAIVSELPGTTRDSVDISYQRDGGRFLFIDTAGIRRRGKLSSSVEVFSVMRAERSIRRADLCVLIVDLTSGVTAQDKRIAGLIQEARKAALVVLNKWDLVKPKRGERQTIRELVDETGERIFFLDYAPVLIASAQTGENIERLFGMIGKIERASMTRIGTGVLNRLIRAAFAANPPPLVKGKRLKLFYAAQAAGPKGRPLQAPEFVLFVN